jgi:hypothetical protein
VSASPGPNWDPPAPLPKRVCSPLDTKGGIHSPAGERGGGLNSDDSRKSLALCLLHGYLSAKFMSDPTGSGFRRCYSRSSFEFYKEQDPFFDLYDLR